MFFMDVAKGVAPNIYATQSCNVFASGIHGVVSCAVRVVRYAGREVFL